MQTLSNPPGVYLSIPFCRQKCTYCNFASEAFPPALFPRYVQALSKEILNRCQLWQRAGLLAREKIEADTLYLGGGTPGMLAAEPLGDLLAAVRASFQVFPEPEITLEASPENVTPASAAAWASRGVNRISLGVQSMVREELRAVGRSHDAAGVAQAFAALRVAGIKNISVDLIAGLPHQTPRSWEASLEAIVELEPAHLSVYMLEVDEDSRLGHEILHHGSRYRAGAVPSGDVIADLYLLAVEYLPKAGFPQYEISNFARLGRQSRHNRKYWTDEAYFGFGIDAHSYDGLRRWANSDSLTVYLERMETDQPPITELRTLLPPEKLEERLFLGLRLREGIRISSLNREFGVDVAEKFARQIRELSEAGWLESAGDRWWLTEGGVLVSNEVFAAFLAERATADS